MIMMEQSHYTSYMGINLIDLRSVIVAIALLASKSRQRIQEETEKCIKTLTKHGLLEVSFRKCVSLDV